MRKTMRFSVAGMPRNQQTDALVDGQQK